MASSSASARGSTEQWSVAANYTHLEREITDPLQPGIEVTGAPGRRGVRRVHLRAVSRSWSITPSVELASDRWSEVTGGGYVRTGDYTLLNLQVQYRGERPLGDRGRRHESAPTRISSSPMAIRSPAAARICGSGSSFEGSASGDRFQRAVVPMGTKLAPPSHWSRKGAPMMQSIADLKRYPVYNRRGDKLGAIDDVVLDADDWSICYAVLRYEVGG